MATSRLFCTFCGAENQPQDTFCFSCGRPLRGIGTTPLLQYPAAGSASNTLTGRLSRDHLLKQRYRILEQLGKGGFGAVYKAEDTQFGNRLVAVKEMSQNELKNQQEISEATEAFKREALMLASLRHQNLPRIYDHFSDGGRWYLVMDFIEGETLEEHLNKAKGGYLSIEETLQIGIQLCTVITYLHTRQPPIIFRDLKPVNIMLTFDAHVYLIDFGIARLFKPGQTKDTTAFGSHGYAAPEQYGKAQTTAQSDIYSLGALLHQLLTGNDPTANVPTIFDFPVLRLPGQSTPAALETLITQMLEKDASKRPQSMDAIKNNLQKILAVQVTGQRSTLQTGGKTPLPPTQPMIRSNISPTQPVGGITLSLVRLTPHRTRVLAIIATILAVVVVLAISIPALVNNHPQPSSPTSLSRSPNTPISVPTVTPFPTPTIVPTPSPTPSPTPTPSPVNILCQAGGSLGWNGWNGTSDWKVLNGQLLNDGTFSGSTSIISAPCDLTNSNNYKMDIKATVLSQGFDPGFDFFVRYVSANTQAYVVALNDNCSAGNPLDELSIWPWSGWCNVINRVTFQPTNNTEYTYEIVVKDNQISVSVNGGLLLEVTDNRYLSGTSVGLGVYEAQVSISSFEITAI